MSLVNSAPRFASLTPFFRLIFDHLLWPDTNPPLARPHLPTLCRLKVRERGQVDQSSRTSSY
jgi:hypothetical protein